MEEVPLPTCAVPDTYHWVFGQWNSDGGFVSHTTGQLKHWAGGSGKTAMFFKKKKKKKKEPRKMLRGAVKVGGVDWQVREEKRGGEQSQILILERDDGRMTMHVRPLPGTEASTLDQVAELATDPTYRFLVDEEDRRWEARILVTSEPGEQPRQLIKFISGTDVYESSYPIDKGLGIVTDAELLGILKNA